MWWIWRLKASFGAPFLILIMSIYWTQGFRSLPWMGISYQLKDKLKLSPSASQFLISLAFMPWSVKPLYGIFSDCVPIRGSRRISYLIISSVISFIPGLILGLVKPIMMSSVYLTGLLTAQNLGAAMADVVIDAMIAEAARKERAEYAGDLQSISWFAMALGGMFASVAGGFALSAFDVNGIFLLFSIFPLLQLIACGLIDEKALTGDCESGEVDEPRNMDTIGDDRNDPDDVKPELLNPYQEQGVNACGKDVREGVPICDKYLADEDEDWVKIEAEKVKLLLEDSNSGSVKRSTRVELGPVDGIKQSDVVEVFEQGGLRRRKVEQEIEGAKKESRDESELRKPETSFICKIRKTFAVLFQAMQQRAIRQPMLWFFLAQISIPSLSTIMFYYQTNFLLLDASFLGTSRLVSWGALMFGTYVYNQYWKHVRLRTIFWWTHIALSFIVLSDVILVTGLNVRLGIPNKAFVVGASALGDAVNQFKFMPFVILSGRLCPPGIEGTLFALFMSLNNFGTTLSSFFGAGLASALDISSNKFENFGMGICIQAFCTIIPIFFLHLIPYEITGVSVNSAD